MNKGPASFDFRPSAPASTGVEMEWILVDQATGAQTPLAPQLLSSLAPSPRIKAELFTSMIEVNTAIHHSTSGCMHELDTLYTTLHSAVTPLGGGLLASGTHPFSHWQQQQISGDPRYARLLARLQWMARRFNIFGIHVHVGMPDGDSCIRVMNRLLPVMPAFLAISANSPFWHGHDTGLSAARIKVFEGLSQGGMPFYFNDWRDFEHCAARLLATGSIDSIRDIWWEMRPHPDFGTLEIRIGDMPLTRADTAAYIAYVRAECMAALCDTTNGNRVHPSLIRENRWRACRHGMHMEFIDPASETAYPFLDWLDKRLAWLDAHGASHEDLAIVRGQLARWRQDGDGATRQRALRQKHAEPDSMIAAMRTQDGWG
ncbi:MAG: YbdK family carboxylate-amine ligase [Zetaproteobacteria bacterium]|nr:MAG: YbdK family carboxylate-amine ligase [Zetaproteobacteria bacterium]